MASLVVVVELEVITKVLWKLKPRTGRAASWIALQQQQGEARKNIGLADGSIRCPYEVCDVQGGQRHNAQKPYPRLISIGVTAMTWNL